MQVRHSTENVPTFARAQRWEQIIGWTYFPLAIRIPRPETFNGKVAVDPVGRLSLSRHRSGGLCYTRNRKHLRLEREEHYLVTIPECSEIRFSQGGTAFNASLVALSFNAATNLMNSVMCTRTPCGC